MPLAQLVQFCHENYNRPDRCGNCPNDECRNGCIACLDYIHRTGTHERSYNCTNIVYCYTCKYIYRYSSEIEFLLNLYHNAFQNAETVKFWSIGCGPAPELFGLNNFKHNYNLTFNIEYKGFDLNDIWHPVHEYISNIDHFDATFYCQDFFNYIETTEDRPHILVLSYLISDILRTNRASIDDFIENLCQFYAPLNNAFLLINDINLGRNNNEARYYFEVIIRRIRALKRLYQLSHENKLHFVNTQRLYFKYGLPHRNNRVQIIPPPEINEAFSPWMECRSSQLVLFNRNGQ